jgi:hypothetical protein
LKDDISDWESDVDDLWDTIDNINNDIEDWKVT